MALARNNKAFDETIIVRGFNNSLKRVAWSRRKEPKPLQIIKQYSESPPLTPAEKSIIESMPGVQWKPRQKYVGFKFNREPEVWESIGFISAHQYMGWLHFQQLTNELFSGYEVDVLHHLSTGTVTSE